MHHGAESKFNTSPLGRGLRQALHSCGADQVRLPGLWRAGQQFYRQRLVWEQGREDLKPKAGQNECNLV